MNLSLMLLWFFARPRPPWWFMVPLVLVLLLFPFWIGVVVIVAVNVAWWIQARAIAAAWARPSPPTVIDSIDQHAADWIPTLLGPCVNARCKRHYGGPDDWDCQMKPARHLAAVPALCGVWLMLDRDNFHTQCSQPAGHAGEHTVTFTTLRTANLAVRPF